MSRNYEEIKKEIENYFNNVTREQLIKDLRESGFEVDENGSGKIIFTDDE